MKIVTKAGMRAILASIAAHAPAAGVFDGLHVALITSAVGGLSPESTAADVTEASYGGYARQAVGAWSAVYDNMDGKCNVEAPTLLFQPTDSVTPQNITGVAYFDAGTAGNLVAVDPFDTPYPLPDAHSGLPWVPVASLSFNTDMGSGVEVV